jgi:spermidine/putrescine transport system substrate-binding protein
MRDRKQDADALWADFTEGRVDRRGFILRALALGASGTAVAAVLEACGGGASEPGSAPASAAASASAPAEPALEAELHIYNWSDYIAEETVPGFEKATGVKVTYNTYESNEELLAKLQIGGGGYDLVVPTGYLVTVLAAQGLLAPLDKARLKNWGNLAPLFLDPEFDRGNAHSVPWQWGTTGIAYRSDKVPTAPDGWSVFHDASLKNKMTMMDDQRDVLGAFLKYRGQSLNATDAAVLAAAKADAIQAKGLLKAYLSAPVKGQLVSGDVWVAQLWNGDTAQAKAEQEAIAYTLPKEGAGIWLDSLVIPRDAPHKNAAHAFIDYVLGPEAGAAISAFTGYGSPNQAAMPKIEGAVPYPTAEEMKRLEYQKDLGAATALWDQIWTEIKSS